MRLLFSPVYSYVRDNVSPRNQVPSFSRKFSKKEECIRDCIFKNELLDYKITGLDLAVSPTAKK